jgi:hypothetical protein
MSTPAPHGLSRTVLRHVLRCSVLLVLLVLPVLVTGAASAAVPSGPSAGHVVLASTVGPPAIPGVTPGGDLLPGEPARSPAG